MYAKQVCISYFSGCQVISSKEENCLAKALALCAIISYFTVVLPLAFAVVLGIATLVGRCTKIESLDDHPTTKVTSHVANAVISPAQRNAQMLAKNLLPDPSLDDLDAIFGKKATYIRNLYKACEKYGETGNLSAKVDVHGGHTTVRRMFSTVSDPMFSALQQELTETRGVHAKHHSAMATNLLAIKSWVTRLLS